MTGGALQRLLFGLDHVGGRPIHPGFGKAIFTAVFQTHARLSQAEGVVPVEIGPVTVFAGGDGLQQVVINFVVGLPGNVDFEGEDFGGGIVDIPGGVIEDGGFGGVYLVAQDVAVIQVAVEPGVGWGDIPGVDKGPLDFEVGGPARRLTNPNTFWWGR